MKICPQVFALPWSRLIFVHGDNHSIGGAGFVWIKLDRFDVSLVCDVTKRRVDVIVSRKFEFD